MDVSLKYGKGTIDLQLPDRNLLGILEATGDLPPLEDLEGTVAVLLEEPTCGPSLESIVERDAPRKIAIIVNDLTRSTPTYRILPPLLEKLETLGLGPEAVTIVVATGTHRGMTEEEIATVVGQDVKNRYAVINHDCDAPDLVSFGELSTGNELRINRTVAEADLRISIGELLLHYYAGFGGGRKSILPGVSWRETVMRNHKMMTFPGASIGKIDGNPVSEEMIEAIGLCPLHFIINVVCDTHKRVVRVVTGDSVEAWREGAGTFAEMNFAPIPRRADAAFVSAGGFPKDINMYQAHKALEMSCRSVRDGGVLVLFAELAEGYGHPVFEAWAKKGLSPEEAIPAFEADFCFGGHKMFYLGKLARRIDVLLCSSVSDEMSRSMYCEKTASPDAAIEEVRRRLGPDFTAYVIPQGGIVLPVPPEEKR